MAVAPLSAGAAARVEAPDLAARCRIEGHHTHLRCGGVEHAIRYDRVALHFRPLKRIVRIVNPRHFQLRHVAAIHLRQRRIANVVRAAIDGPFPIACPGGAQREQAENQSRRFIGHSISIDAHPVSMARPVSMRAQYRSAQRASWRAGRPLGPCVQRSQSCERASELRRHLGMARALSDMSHSAIM